MRSKRIRSAQLSYRRLVRSRLFVEPLEDRRLLATFVNAIDDVGATSEDTPTTIQVLANDTTDGSTAPTVTSVSKPANGSVAIRPDGSVAYTPNANFFGTDTFSYTISDGAASPIQVTPGRSTFDMFAKANSTTQPSTLKTDFFTNMQAGTTSLLRGDVSAVSAANGRVEMSAYGEVEWVSPSVGQVTLLNVVWDRQNSFEGSASLAENSGWTYQFTPSTSGTFILNHNIQVTNSFGAQDLGEFRFAWSGPGGSSSQLINSDNLSNSVGQTSFPVLANQTYTVSLYNNFAIAWGSQFGVYDREAMNAAFNFRIVGSPVTDTAMVTVTVSPVNDPPVANDDSATTNEDTAVNILVLSNDIDVDGDGRTISDVSQPANGRVSIGVTAPFLRYTPNPGFAGTDTFIYMISDGKGGIDTATVTVTVAAVNDPTIADDIQISTSEDSNVSGQVSATDQDSAAVTFDRLAGPYHGVLTSFNSQTGEFTYVPNPNFNGTDTFTYLASDGQAASGPATVTITINPVNDTPIAHGWQFGTSEDTPLSEFLRASDVDGDALTYAIVQNPGFGTVQLNPTTGTFIYTPNPGYTQTDVFTFRVNDGTADSNIARVFVTVWPTNDPPVSQPQQIVTDEDVSKSGTLIASDTDSPLLTYTIVTPPAHGTIVGFSPTSPNFTYVPAANYSGPDSFTFRASDGSSVSNHSTVSITVQPVADAPIASDDSASIKEDALLSINVVDNDRDGDGDPLTITAISQPANGSAAISPNGVITYTPRSDFNGVDSLTYTISDGNGGTATATLNITITAVIDPPVSSELTFVTDEDMAFASQLVASDVDSPTLTYTIVTPPQHGSLDQFNPATGQFNYYPNANYFGSDSFTFTASDGSGVSNVSTVSITVASVNDAPVAVGQTATTNEDQPISGQLSATDVDGPSVAYAIVSGPVNGTLTSFDPATGAYTYLPTANFHGNDSFVFRASNSDGASSTATVELQIKSVNDLPQATDAVFTLAEDAAAGAVLGTIAATDIDHAALSYVLSEADSAAFSIDAQTGRISVANSALLDYEARQTLQFVVTVIDAAGGRDTANVTVNVTNVAEVAVDVLPSDASNRIDLGSSAVEVAILATSSFNPLARVDLGSLRLKVPNSTTSASVSSHPKHGYKYEQRDANGDGRLDLVVSFSTSATGLKTGDTKVQLSGRLQDGELFLIEQTVQVVAPSKGGGKGNGGGKK